MPPKGTKTADGGQWFYRGDDMEWVAFKPKDNSTLESAWANNEGNVTMSIGSFKYVVDIDEMTQRNEKSGKTRYLRRKGPSGEVVVRAVVWEWEGHGTFHPYNQATSDEIEKAYQSEQLRTQVNVQTSAHDTKKMIIHFGHMHQFPDGEAESTRRIRRVEKPLSRMATGLSPYVATASGLPPGTMTIPPSTAPTPTITEPASRSTAKRARSPAAASGAAPAVATPHRAEGADVAAIEAEKKHVSADDVPFSAPPVGPPIPANPNLDIKAWRMVRGTIMALAAHSPAPGTALRVAAFDMDDTLIRPKSMDAKKKKFATFAKSADDWDWLHPTVPQRLRELHGNGYLVLIVSNQGGIEKDANKANWVKTKVLAMQDAAKTPISFVCATHEDANRKPGPAMWDCLSSEVFPAPNLTIDHANSFYCGDAAGRYGFTTLAGREKDFSCSDRKFAFNVGVRFFTPEQWLIGKVAKVQFNWEDFGPDELEKLATAKHVRDTYASAVKEMVVMVGWPGSGKSSFVREFLIPHGYVHVNRDTLKTMDKCEAAADAALASGKSVVIDNTSPEPADRQRWLKIARKHGAAARIFRMETTRAMAWHMNLVRAQLGIAPRVSSIGYNIYSGKFREPNAKAEDYDDVVSVPVVPSFKGLPPNAKRLLLHTLT
jgi:bifunctional polynucleotide phosphatase/kinase